VIFATLTGSQGSYNLNVDIQQPAGTPAHYRNHWVNSFTWKASPRAGDSRSIPEELLTNIRSASDWIRHEAGESADDIARLDVPPADVTTGSWQALTEYANGERLAAARRSEDAVLAFQNATAEDAKFALAYARAGDLLVSMNKRTQGYDAYNHALAADLNHRLTRRERDFIKGAFATDTADYATGEAAFRDYAEFYENDYSGVFFRAYPLRMMGRFREAVEVLKRAHEISPTAAGAYMGLAYNYMLLRDFTSARANIGALQQMGRRDNAAMLGGHLAFLEDRPLDAASLFTSLGTSEAADQRSLGYVLRARLAAEYGNYPKAIADLDAGIEEDRTRGDQELEGSKLLDRAYLRCRLGDRSSCFGDLRRAVDLTSRPDNLIRASAILGTAIAGPHVSPALRAAMTVQLESLEKKLPTQDYGVIFQLARFRIQGELLMARNKPKLAVAKFRKADALDSPIADRDYLARGLVAMASTLNSEPEAHSFLEEALTLREHMANNPQLVWNFSPRYPPGFLADELANYLELSTKLGHHSDIEKKIHAHYRRLRNQEHPSAGMDIGFRKD
jgi:tetratricopeptide (TPR) repeat protein